MNILYLDWPCFGKIDTIFTLEQLGHTVTKFFHKNYQHSVCKEFDDYFDSVVEDKHFDCCFSFNYTPLVSENCKKHNIKYIAVVYDSPYSLLYSYTIINPNNYIFLFDSSDYVKFKKMGIQTVYRCTLPVNGSIIDHLLTKPFDKERFTCDISFIGSLYNEKHNYFDRLAGINDFTRGYIDALIATQLKIYGYNFVEECLTPKIVKEIENVIKFSDSPYGIETPEYIYANFYIGRRITQIDRLNTLSAVARKFPLKLFTVNKEAVIPNAQNMGAVDYYLEMPYVFANSKINLNITSRSIESGIPLRAMDILGAGGFLLTNYQEDLFNHFIPDEDFVFYSNEEDMLKKIEYYLQNENERKRIAHNGHMKVKENHSFEKFFEYIFSVVF